MVARHNTTFSYSVDGGTVTSRIHSIQLKSVATVSANKLNTMREVEHWTVSRICMDDPSHSRCTWARACNITPVEQISLSFFEKFNNMIRWFDYYRTVVDCGLAHHASASSLHARTLSCSLPTKNESCVCVCVSLQSTTSPWIDEIVNASHLWLFQRLLLYLSHARHQTFYSMREKAISIYEFYLLASPSHSRHYGNASSWARGMFNVHHPKWQRNRYIWIQNENI